MKDNFIIGKGAFEVSPKDLLNSVIFKIFTRGSVFIDFEREEGKGKRNTDVKDTSMGVASWNAPCPGN